MATNPKERLRLAKLKAKEEKVDKPKTQMLN